MDGKRPKQLTQEEYLAPPTEEERAAALEALIVTEVRLTRLAKRRDEIDTWDYNNGRTVR